MRRFHPIKWLRAHPFVADLILAVVVAVPTILGLILSPKDDPDLHVATWWGIVLAIGTTLPIAWRRSSPIRVLAIISACQFMLDFHEFAGSGFPMLVALYTVAAHVPPPRSIRIAVGYIAAYLAFITLGLLTGRPLWGALVASGITLTASFALGDNMRRRRERLDWLTERADRAERERELLARERVSEERARIARELHDVVAHSVSLMVIQAGAARRQLDTNPEQARGAMSVIETTGRTAMTEMRRILGVLRHEEGHDLAPLPQLTDLAELVAATNDLPVRLATSGDLDALPVSTQLAAYRMVQEALTNVRRHAGVVRDVAVLAAHEGDQLRIEITDDGRGASTLPADAHGTVTKPLAPTGYGLLGMRERVESAAGRLIAGPRSGGGWRVAATFAVHDGTS